MAPRRVQIAYHRAPADRDAEIQRILGQLSVRKAIRCLRRPERPSMDTLNLPSVQ
jgi:hypothetical protein